MDDTITRGIIYGSCPPNGVYFTVVVEYNHEHSIFDGSVKPGEGLQSSPIKSFPDAMKISDQLSNELIDEKFSGAKLKEIDADQGEGYHIYIIDDEEKCIARVGVETYDVRDETFH